ncbi:MAG: N-acetylmuramoyl-L-alanine amidase [Clostridia bacterium]|nr:N-acetylmuramoyl-L-alanine amidase [Clostridia bacterium]
MKIKRILATILSMVMLMGLVVAFPSALKTIEASAAVTTNYALTATYRGGDTNLCNGTSAGYGEDNWNSYHSGRLNDGKISASYLDSYMLENVEMYINGFAPGTVYVYYKLASAVNVTEVNVYTSIRNPANSTSRAHPSSINVYVGNSESSTNALGAVNSSAYNTGVNKNTANGSIVGNYVIIEMAIPSYTQCVIALTEVEILGTPTSVINVAPNAMYRGSDDSVPNNGTTDTSWGEANWNTYHNGKLNDNIISTTYIDNDHEKNVEFWRTGFTAGTVYVYFQLPAEMEILEVNVYTNDRSPTGSSTSRSHPSTVGVYVGSSESASASLGSTSYKAYNESVRKYTASGSAKGNYVAIALEIPSVTKCVIALTEVQIYCNVETSENDNVAGTATYRGADDILCNGTSAGVGENDWNTYHSGKLNDGVISSNYSNVDTANNVEIYKTGFITGATMYIYFKLPEAIPITEVNVYSNDMNPASDANSSREHPESVTVYVGTSEGAGSVLGTASYTDYNAYVRKFSAKGLLTGNYVSIAVKIPATGTSCVTALTEVEIMTIGDKTLDTPVLSINTKQASFTVPTITWEAVENAEVYDVYLNGTLVVENTTTCSYTPDIAPFNLYGYDGNRTCESVTVIAKGTDYEDSEASKAVEFLYVPKPTDINGNEVTSADVIIDAGHGGADIGSTLDTRYESNDNLTIALAIGKLLEDVGYTVAYTRTDDSLDSVYTKAAMGVAGDFDVFLCLHRNSYTDATATGSLYYYLEGDTDSQALANAIEAEIVADGIWDNKGSQASSFIVLTKDDVTACHMELGYISSADDNAKFDTYLNETAQAIARGTINYLNDAVGYEGILEKPVASTINNAAASVSTTVASTAGSVLDIEGWVLNTYGVESYEYSVDGGDWTALEVYDRSSELSGYTNYKNAANAGYRGSISTEGWADGMYTINVRGTNVWDSTTKRTNTFDVATIYLTVRADYVPGQYTVTFVGKDGDVLSTQIVLEGEAAVAPVAPSVQGYNFSGWDNAFDSVMADMVITAQYTAKEYPFQAPTFGLTVEAQLGTFDPDGPEVDNIPVGEYIAVDIKLDSVDIEANPWGIASFEALLQFDTEALIPLYYNQQQLNGEVGVTDPMPIYSWPTYTVSLTVPGLSAPVVYDLFAVKGLCWSYAYLMEDGTFVGTGEVPEGDPDADREFSIDKGYLKLTYLINSEKYKLSTGIGDEGMFPEDNIVMRHYFKAADGSFDVGESFTFTVPDAQNKDQYGNDIPEGELPYAGTCQLYGASYQGPDAPISHLNAYGMGDTTTLTIAEQTKYYNVTFLDMDGNQIGDVQSVEEGTAAVAPEAPEVEGYTFTGWDIEFNNVTADLIVTAQYTINTYTVTFVAGEGGSISGTASVKVDHGTNLSTVTYPDAVADTGYEFSAWDVTEGTVTGDMIITASFTEKAPAEFFVFEEDADTTYVVKSTVTTNLYFKAGALTAAEMKALFVDIDITITKANGTAIADTANVGTGAIITSTIDGESKSLTVIVLGDITGDGEINGTDYAQVLLCAKGKKLITDTAKLHAANVNGPNADGTVSAEDIAGSDYAQILLIAKGKRTYLNTQVK